MTVHHLRSRGGAVLLAAAVTFAGCSSTSFQGSDEGGAPTSAASELRADAVTSSGVDGDGVDGDDSGDDHFQRSLTPAAELVDPSPVDIVDMRPSATGSDGETLVLAFELGSYRCNGIEVSIDETDSEVTVGLQGGSLPDVDPLDCEYGVYPYTTTIALDAPLGDRVVVPSEPRANGSASTPAGVAGIIVDEEAEAGQSVDFLRGEFIEDAVEWAIVNDIDWRVISFDGEQLAETPPQDPGRIAFVVEADRVVAYEWS